MDSLRVWQADEARFSRFPASQEIFGKAYQPGDRFIQADLAQTLERIAKDPDDFYEGETARRLADAMASNGGLITREDLKAYKAVERHLCPASTRALTLRLRHLQALAGLDYCRCWAC